MPQRAQRTSDDSTDCTCGPRSSAGGANGLRRRLMPRHRLRHLFSRAVCAIPRRPACSVCRIGSRKAQHRAGRAVRRAGARSYHEAFALWRRRRSAAPRIRCRNTAPRAAPAHRLDRVAVKMRAWNTRERGAVAGAALGECGDRAPGAQALAHPHHHLAHESALPRRRKIVSRLRGQPADHRPAADLRLRDEAHHVLRMQGDDVDPADA